MQSNNDWFYEYFINEVKAIGRQPTSNMQYEVVDSLPSSGNEQTIYFVKNDSSSTNDYYDEYVWISSSSTFEKIGSSQIDDFIPNPSIAKIGQTIVVKEIDENRKPTSWEMVDLPSGGDNVPKPLTFDYMPEGYPTKSVQTTTLMEEQELAFTAADYFYMSQLTNAFEIVVGQTYTVNWDGTEYECVGAVFGEGAYVFGNLSIMGTGADTGEPFIYLYNAKQAVGMFATLDTAASHTISVKTAEEIVTPMAAEFLPSEINELIMNSSTTGSTKKFKITVDDNSSLKVVNTTDSSEVTMAKTSEIPTDDHINELINTALSKIGIAEEGAY